VIARFRRWLHRACRLERGTADAVLSIGEQLGYLTGAVHTMRDELQRLPAFVTVIVLGREASGATLIFSQTGVIGRPRAGHRTTQIRVDILRPLRDCCAFVLCDLARVDVRCITCGIDAVAMGAPFGVFGAADPGQVVSAIVELREPE
jgi:hypothetical protein